MPGSVRTSVQDVPTAITLLATSSSTTGLTTSSIWHTSAKFVARDSLQGKNCHFRISFKNNNFSYGMHFRCNAHYHYILVHEKKKLRMRDIPPNFFKDNKVKVQMEKV